jgi:chromosome partitioning protein
MPIIAVINRKGGSGKSTTATHIAAWLAHQGCSVMLGDVDKQQSSKIWLKHRDVNLPKILSWQIDQKCTLKIPQGVTHVVLDTPGGMQGFDLARVVMSADAIVIPVCNSMFDRESAAAGYAELRGLPRIASGRCQTASIGMRLDPSPESEARMRQWAQATGIVFLAAIQQSPLYVQNIEIGKTLFDMPNAGASKELLQWAPVLEWLRPIAKLTGSGSGPVLKDSTTANNRSAYAHTAQSLHAQPQHRHPLLTPPPTPKSNPILQKRIPLQAAERVSNIVSLRPAQSVIRSSAPCALTRTASCTISTASPMEQAIGIPRFLLNPSRYLA